MKKLIQKLRKNNDRGLRIILGSLVAVPFLLFLLLQSNLLLKPYVWKLREDTPCENLKLIAAMKEGELIRLHQRYGAGIRNKWLWGERDKILLTSFRLQGVHHPDEMSGEIINALWKDLQKNKVNEACILNITCEDEYSVKNEVSDHGLSLKIEETTSNVYEATVMKLGYTPEVLRKIEVVKVAEKDNQFKFEGPNLSFNLVGTNGLLEVEVDYPVGAASQDMPTNKFKEKMNCNTFHK